MLIGEVANKYGINVDTLRYYDKIGLLKVKRKESVRQYAQDDLKKLEDIIKMKSLMFSLDEIALLLTIDARVEEGMCRGEIDPNHLEKMRQMIHHRTDEINTLEQDLHRVRDYLHVMLRKIEDVLK